MIEDLPAARAQAALPAVFKRLGGSIDAPFDAAGAGVSIAMSAGVVLSPRDGTTLQALLRRGRMISPLRAAKSRGRRGGRLVGTGRR